MGATILQQFSGNPIYNIFGVVTGTASCTQFISGTANLLRFKADPDNVGTFYLGSYGTGECIWPMDAGDDTGWIAAPFGEGHTQGIQFFTYQNLSGTTDRLHYWIQR